MIHFTENSFAPQSLAEAQKILKSFRFPIELVQKDDKWQIWDGDQLTGYADNFEIASAYVFGQAALLNGLQPAIQDSIRAENGVTEEDYK